MADRARVSSRVSVRSALVLLLALLGIVAVVLLAVFGGARALQGSWSLAAISVAAICVLAVAAFFFTWPEVHRVAKKEQIAALRRIVSVLGASQAVQHQVLNSVQIALRDTTGPGATSTTIRVFLSRNDLFQFRSTILLGVRGAGKSTLMARLATTVAEQTATDRGSHWPLYVSARNWTNGGHLNGWVETEMTRTFRVRRRVTSAWLHSPKSILFVDGIDDLESPAYREDLLTSIAIWQRKPWGGKVVVSATEAQGEVAAKILSADRIAQIQPVKIAAAERMLREILEHSEIFSSFSSPERLGEQMKFLQEQTSEGMRPSLVRALEKGTSAPEAVHSSTSVDWLKLLIKADVELQHDSKQAVSDYLRIADGASTSLAAVALMRATLVQAGMGQVEAAEVQLNRALELFEDMNPLEVDEVSIETLSEGERTVLAVIGSERGLLAEEIVSRTMLRPSEVNASITSLIAKGYAFVREVGRSRTAFYESALVNRSDGLTSARTAHSMSWSKSNK